MHSTCFLPASCGASVSTVAPPSAIVCTSFSLPKNAFLYRNSVPDLAASRRFCHVCFGRLRPATGRWPASHTCTLPRSTSDDAVTNAARSPGGSHTSSRSNARSTSSPADRAASGAVPRPSPGCTVGDSGTPAVTVASEDGRPSAWCGGATGERLEDRTYADSGRVIDRSVGAAPRRRCNARDARSNAVVTALLAISDAALAAAARTAARRCTTTRSRCSRWAASCSASLLRWDAAWASWAAEARLACSSSRPLSTSTCDRAADASAPARAAWTRAAWAVWRAWSSATDAAPAPAALRVVWEDGAVATVARVPGVAAYRLAAASSAPRVMAWPAMVSATIRVCDTAGGS